MRADVGCGRVPAGLYSVFKEKNDNLKLTYRRRGVGSKRKLGLLFGFVGEGKRLENTDPRVRRRLLLKAFYTARMFAHSGTSLRRGS